MNRRTMLPLFVSLMPLVASAQDIATVAPKNIKVLLDNSEVRVLEYTSAKGVKIGTHSHPPYVIYSLANGKTRFTMPDGTTRELAVKAGEAVWSDGGAHSQESLTSNHAIVIELKQAKPLAKK